MLIRHVAACAALALVVTLSSAPVGAQPKTLACASLLTADELNAIIGEKMTDMGPRERSAGETECPWMLRGGSGFKTVAVQFYDLESIKALPATPTPDTFFESLVKGAEGMASGGKREMLPGIGQKAAFVPTTPQVLVVVQRANGVARIVGNNLTKAQITAVARAVAAP